MGIYGQFLEPGPEVAPLCRVPSPWIPGHKPPAAFGGSEKVCNRRTQSITLLFLLHLSQQVFSFSGHM